MICKEYPIKIEANCFNHVFSKKISTFTEYLPMFQEIYSNILSRSNVNRSLAVTGYGVS